MKLSCYDHDGAKERSIAFGADFEVTVDCTVCQNYADCKCNGTGWCVAEKATSTPIRHLWSVFVTSGSIMSTFFEDHLEKKKYVIVTATTRNKKLDSWFVVNFLMCCARIRKWHLECPLPLPISFDCIGRFSFWVSRLFIHSVGVEIGECAVGVVYPVRNAHFSWFNWHHRRCNFRFVTELFILRRRIWQIGFCSKFNMCSVESNNCRRLCLRPKCVLDKNEKKKMSSVRRRNNARKRCACAHSFLWINYTSCSLTYQLHNIWRGARSRMRTKRENKPACTTLIYRRRLTE
jgi:hypothetical protein